MTPAAELYGKFLHRLRSRQRVAAIRIFGDAALAALPIAAALSACGRWGVAMSWENAAGAFLLVFGIGTGVFFWRNFPGLMTCARCFDRAGRTNSRAINALELVRRGDVSPFALYAVAEGVAALNREALRTGLPTRRGRLVPWYGAMVLVGVCLLAGAFWRTRNGAAGERAESMAALAPSVSGEGIQVRRTLGPVPFVGANESQAPGASRRSGTPERRNRRQGALPGSDASAASVDEAAMRESSAEMAVASAENEVGKSTASRAAATGRHGEEAGAWENSESAAEAAQFSAGEEGLGRSPARRSRRKRAIRRNPESALGGAQPLLADNAPPAGRELAEKDGEGDRPDSGRGGPSGEKKSRGTAAMLPVTPLPDLVGGLLAQGEEMTLPEKTGIQQAAGSEGTVRVSANAPEPSLPEGYLPLALRKLHVEGRLAN